MARVRENVHSYKAGPHPVIAVLSRAIRERSPPGGGMSNGPLFATRTFVWGLAAICQLHRRPFAPALVLQQFSPPYGPRSLEEAATSLQLKAGLRTVAPADLHAMPAP